VLTALLKFLLPLAVIAIGAFLILQYGHSGSGYLRVSSTVPGAEIYIGGIQSGVRTDTTLRAMLGRAIVTVRKSGYISDPEFIAIEIVRDRVNQARFILRKERDTIVRDTVPAPRPVASDILSTGQTIRSVPPTMIPFNRKYVDYSNQDRASSNLTSPPVLLPTDRPAVETYRSDTTARSLTGTQITVTTSGAAGGEIYINGLPSSKMTPYTFRELDRGTYVLRIQLAGFTCKPDSIVMVLTRDYQSELAAFNVTQNPSLPKPTLTISTIPPAAGIKVDGQQVGIGKISLVRNYGKYKIEFADVPGFTTPSPISGALTEAMAHDSLVGEYRRMSGNAYIALQPAEDLHVLNGQQLRVYVDNELIVDRPDQSLDAVLIGKILSGRRLLRVQYGDLTNDVHVNALDGEVILISMRIESFFSKRSLRLRDKNVGSQEEWLKRNLKLRVLTIS
jgi:hypothetical protein